MPYRTLTQAQLVAEARARFGDNQRSWAFICPHCGDIATASDFTQAGADPHMIGQECVGRHLGALTKAATGTDGHAFASRGCDWTAYGLFPGPWVIEIPGRPETRTVSSFELAPASPVIVPLELDEHTLTVLQAIAMGDSMVAIADRMGLSYDQVRRPFSVALRASNAKSREVLVHRACVRGRMPHDLPRREPYRPLTVAELRIVRHIAAGDIQRRIAAWFQQPHNTLKGYVKRALAAQRANTTAQLVYLVWRDGLIGADLCTCHDGWPPASCPVHRGPRRAPVLVDVHLPTPVGEAVHG